MVDPHLLESLPARLYAICALLLVLKMMALAVYTSALRMRKKRLRLAGGLQLPGEARLRRAAIREVERARRAHRNDLENVLPFLVVGPIYVLDRARASPARGSASSASRPRASSTPSSTCARRCPTARSPTRAGFAHHALDGALLGLGAAALTPRGRTIAAPRLEIRYCTQCRWLLRAAWTAQELLTTFEAELGEVALAAGDGRRLRGARSTARCSGRARSRAASRSCAS